MSSIEADAPNVPTLVPLQSVPITADEAFARYENQIDPSLTSADLTVSSDAPKPFGRGFAVDVYGSQLVQADLGGVLQTRGEATLRAWIEKTLHTARGAHAIYPDDFGVERPHELFGGPLDRFPIGEAEARWTDALLKHPRITDVVDWFIDIDTLEDKEAVLVECTIVVDGSEVDVSGITVTA